MNEETLKKKMAALPELDERGSKSWSGKRANIREMVAKEDLTKFIKWPTIVGTMFVGSGKVANHELEALKEDDWPRWEKAIYDMGECGAPKMHLMNTTGNAIHQAYHLMKFEQRVGLTVDKLGSILELGGGYGTMARVVYQSGFKGEYVIWDLPEFSLLQGYYLSQVGVGVKCVSEPPKQNFDLFMALWSLGEIPIVERAGVMTGFSSIFYYYAYCHTWDGEDNLGFFRYLATENKKYMIWTEEKINHLDGNLRMVGRPRP